MSSRGYQYPEPERAIQAAKEGGAAAALLVFIPGGGWSGSHGVGVNWSQTSATRAICLSISCAWHRQKWAGGVWHLGIQFELRGDWQPPQSKALEERLGLEIQSPNDPVHSIEQLQDWGFRC